MKIIIIITVLISVFGVFKKLIVSKNRIDNIIRDYKTKFPLIDHDLVVAIIAVESNFNATAYRYETHIDDTSIGLMQILTSTAKDMGFVGSIEELSIPRTNIYYGMAYLDWLQKYFGTYNLEGVIMSYNVGIGNYKKGKRVPEYYKKVLREMQKYES